MVVVVFSAHFVVGIPPFMLVAVFPAHCRLLPVFFPTQYTTTILHRPQADKLVIVVTRTLPALPAVPSLLTYPTLLSFQTILSFQIHKIFPTAISFLVLILFPTFISFPTLI